MPAQYKRKAGLPLIAAQALLFQKNKSVLLTCVCRDCFVPRNDGFGFPRPVHHFVYGGQAYF
jgi:hypothetical protein